MVVVVVFVVYEKKMNNNLTGNIASQITIEDAAEKFVQFFLCSMGLLGLCKFVC